MGFTGISPVVKVLNNGLYGVDALISEAGHAYNNIPVWRYADIVKTLVCRGWWCGKASSLAELDQALAAINNHSDAVYLEILIPPEEFPVSASPLNAL